MRDCGTCHPPADGTLARETMDRFADFLAEGVPPIRSVIAALSPARRYRFHFLMWRVDQVPA